MYHTREQVIERVTREYELLDKLIANLSDEDWRRPLLRPEGKDPWTVKDTVAHLTHWRADAARSARKQRRPPEERGLETNAANHIIYMRWRDRSPQEVLAWHKQVQQDVLSALRAAPDEYFTGKDRNEQWPFDLDGHVAFHRIHDIEQALKAGPRR